MNRPTGGAAHVRGWTSKGRPSMDPGGGCEEGDCPPRAVPQGPEVPGGDAAAVGGQGQGRFAGRVGVGDDAPGDTGPGEGLAQRADLRPPVTALGVPGELRNGP